MCYSFYIDLDREFTRELKEKILSSKLTAGFENTGKKVITRGIIRPSDIVPVIAADRRGERSVFPMKWGFRLSRGDLVANARSESASEKPLFREAWKAHRCIIPASWYYEWSHYTDNSGKKRTGDRYRIGMKDSLFTYLCGLYRLEEGLPVFTVLTRAPVGELAKIHDRMPLILKEENIEKWIYPDTDPALLLGESVTSLQYGPDRG